AKQAKMRTSLLYMLIGVKNMIMTQQPDSGNSLEPCLMRAQILLLATIRMSYKVWKFTTIPSFFTASVTLYLTRAGRGRKTVRLSNINSFKMGLDDLKSRH